MDRRKLIYMIVGVVLFVALLFWLLSVGGQDTTKENTTNNPEPPYSSSRWLFKPKLGNKDPYGLYVFEQLLISSGQFDAFNEVLFYELMDSIQLTDDNVFMFVGDHFALTEREVTDMMLSIYRGNELFLCAEQFPSYFASHVLRDPEWSYLAEDSVYFSIGKDLYSMYYVFEKDTLSAVWKQFRSAPDSIVVSRINGAANYIKIPIGDGFIHWHTNVLAFQNFQLLRKEGLDYQKRVLSQIKNKKIQWLAYTDYEPYYDEDWNDQGSGTSLLTEIFAYDSLRWAFFLAAVGACLFFIFRSKREQPIVELNMDNAIPGISYVDTIAGIYFANQSPWKVIAMLRKNFYIAVQEHFFLDLQNRTSSAPISVLAEKAKIPVNQVTDLIEQLESKTSVSKVHLTEVHARLRMFYLESGVWKSWKQSENKRLFHFYRDKTYPLLFILLGLISIVSGFVLLSLAIGTGVVLWPLGIGLTYLGARLLNQPVCSMNAHQLIVRPLFGKTMRIAKSEVKSLSMKAEEVVVGTFQKEVSLNLLNIEPRARKKLVDLLYTFKSK